MKTIIIFLLILIPFSASSQGNIGLIAHWNFNGNANDVSGHNLNGIITGATLTAGYSNIANTAYSFNGNGDHIDVPFDSLMNIDSAFAISTLIKPVGFYSGRAQGNFILTRGAEWGPDYYQLGYCDNAYDNSDDIYSPNNEVFYSSVPQYSQLPWYNGNTIVQLNTWYCVTVNYDGDSIKIFVDGVRKAAQALHKIYVPGIDGIGIGYYPARVSDFPYWINGIIDDIRLYDRSLSDAEVKQYCDSAKMLPSDVPQISAAQPFQVSVYPNPFTTATNFTFSSALQNGELLITNIYGKTIEKYTNLNSDKFILRRNTLSSGMYFYSVNSNGITLSKGKLLVQ